MTHQVKIAPPVRKKSVVFIAISILNIEIKLIPTAVLKANLRVKFCLKSIIVSKIILVIIPLIIAKTIIAKIGKGIFVSWKNKIVPKSPMEQPSKHQNVFLALLDQVCLQLQLNVSELIMQYLNHYQFSEMGAL